VAGAQNGWAICQAHPANCSIAAAGRLPRSDRESPATLLRAHGVVHRLGAGALAVALAVVAARLFASLGGRGDCAAPPDESCRLSPHHAVRHSAIVVGGLRY